MGVPKFAAWLTKKYPMMVQRACPAEVHGLYVDLNGLIHPCCHDEDDPSVALRPEAEKLRQICLAVETLVVTTRPRHVIYIAVDGVAPRAKMNQQRARRYMSTAEPISLRGGGGALVALESEFTTEQKIEAEEELDNVAKDLLSDALYGDDAAVDTAAGVPVLLPDPAALIEDFSQAKPLLETSAGRSMGVGRGGGGGSGDGDAFDGNCISPGTEFMAKVSVAVREFLEEKMAAADPMWAHTTVVFSDANTPGEGEHKLLDFLRTQASFSGFNGHGAHVIAGLDADLIFLSLSLHIPHVYILRDNKRPSSFDKKKGKGAQGTQKRGGAGKAKALSDSEDSAALESSGEDVADDGDVDAGTGAEDAAAAIVEACTSYEYYDIDLVGSSLVSEIFLLSKMKGFVMKADVRAATQGELVAGNGYCFDRVAGKPDGEKKTSWPGQDRTQDLTGFHPCTATCNSKIIDDFIVMAMVMGNDFLPRVPSAFCGESIMDNIIEVYVSCVLPYGYLTLGAHEIDLKQLARFFKAYAQIEAVKFRQYCIKQDVMTAHESATPIDNEAVDARWRQPYYDSTTVTLKTREDACRKYVEGLRFVWRYYSTTSAQVSWSWYYPYHHGPFAYDLYKFIESQGPDVQTTLPPAKLETTAPEIFAQQLCILPPASKALLPEIFRRYMTHPPEDLVDTFPKEWNVDFTAAYNKEHLATVMLPFANMDRLKLLVREFSSHLSEAEQERQRNNDFHLVLKRAPAETGPTEEAVGDDDGTPAGKPKAAAYVFEVKGKGISALPRSKVPSWHLRTDCEALRYYQLRETEPELCRPRTYTTNVPVYNLTTAADGKVIRINNNKKARELRQQQQQKQQQRGADASRGNAAGKRKEGKKPDDGEGEMTIGRAVTMAIPNFAEFAVAACGVAVLTLLATTAACNVAVKVQAGGLLVGVLMLAYTVGCAVGASGNRKGSGIHRNNIRMTFVDWQCGNCLCLNFSRNNRCFVCSAPFDEHHDWALFSGKNPPDPPLMDTHHEKYMERFGRVD